MQKSTDMWFRYLNKNHMITEGLRDVGLPEFVIDYIEDAMPDASEKARMYIALGWKESTGGMAGAFTIPSLQYEVFQFLHQEYAQYVIQKNSPNKEAGMADIEARTVSMFDINKGTNAPREAYDEERIKQNEQVKFVIDNLRNAVARPMGSWRKAFMKAVKALSKAGLPSEKVETTKEYLRSLYAKNFHFWINQYSELIDFLNDDPTNYELIKDEYSLQDAHRKAVKYLQSKEDPEFIMHTFEDGSYWYNLNVSSCDVEASRMGHCGTDSRGVLVSLRKKQGKRRESSSYVTMTWSEYENTLYQIKGRSNDAPPEETWDHIVWFIDNYNIQNVEETGEHSNDYDGFAEMNEYLASRTNANFHGSIEDRIEKAEEFCEGQMQRFSDNQNELEYGDVGYTLEEEGNDIYCYANASYEFEIDLGWPGYSATDMGFKPDAGDFEEIPRNYSGMREFFEELGVDDMMYEMPGDDGDYDYDLKMLIGAQPEGQELDPEPPATVHIVFRLSTHETLSVDEDGEVPEFEEFVDNMLAFEEDQSDEYRESIRQALAAGGYTSKTAYDRSKEELMKITNLDKWHVKEDRGGLEFDWTADDGQPLHDYMGSVKFDSAKAQMYGTGTGNVMGVNPDSVRNQLFGYGPRYSFANLRGTADFTVQFARELSRNITTQIKTTRNPESQLNFDFGDEYKDVDPTMILADDTYFVIFTNVSYNRTLREQYPTITIKWLYRMRIDSNSEPDESEVIQDIAAYLNEHEELVQSAADTVIGAVVQDFMNTIERNRNAMMDNVKVQEIINRVKQIYISAADAGSDVAEKTWLIASWIENNYDKMNEPERYIAMTRYLIPMNRNVFRAFSDLGAVEGTRASDPDDEYKPSMFDELAAAQRERMGGQPVNMARRNESIEDQIERIESLINEADPSYDLRIYNIEVGCTVDNDIGGSESETATEIRGIPGVTTVRPVAAKKRDITASAEYVLYDIKFELLGAQSRVEYRDEILLPALRRIRGLKVLTVTSMHRTNRKGTIRTVRESQVLQEYGGVVSNFGGLAGGLGQIPRDDITTTRPTPRHAVQKMIDDWAEGGVMAYDAPVDTTDMRYHSMIPVDELVPYSPRMYRSDKREFDARYKMFIKTGPTYPVYLSIGQNGRAKVTGGEDLIFFAKKSGLKELPVFFSFQKQV